MPIEIAFEQGFTEIVEFLKGARIFIIYLKFVCCVLINVGDMGQSSHLIIHTSTGRTRNWRMS